MTSQQSTPIQPLALIQPMATGVIAMAMVSAMSQSFAYTGFAASMSPKDELASLNERIRKLSYRLENQRNAVVGHRQQRVKLMHEYGITVTPSVVEMKKYPKLRTLDYYLRTSEKDLDKMELSMMYLQKRRKELQMKLGISPYEEEHARRVYPATKKFTPPPGY